MLQSQLISIAAPVTRLTILMKFSNTKSSLKRFITTFSNTDLFSKLFTALIKKFIKMK